MRCTAVHENRPQPYCLRYALTPGWRVKWHEPQVVIGSPCVAIVCLRASTRASSSNLFGHVRRRLLLPLPAGEGGGEGPRDAWTPIFLFFFPPPPPPPFFFFFFFFFFFKYDDNRL